MSLSCHLGIIPYRGVQFGLNDTIKGLNPWAKDVTFTGIASKWAGAQFSVIMSGYVTYPFDTVRRRLQMQAEKPINERLYKGAVHCLNKIIKDEGFSALFKGAGANILRGTGAALVLVLYGMLFPLYFLPILLLIVYFSVSFFIIVGEAQDYMARH